MNTYFSYIHQIDFIGTRRWSSHGKIYIEKCAEAHVEPHHCAVTISDGKDEDTWPTLDSFVHNVPGLWTSKGLLEHIVELFVTEDKVICFLVPTILR